MKKTLASLLVVLMVFGMFGCSQSDDQPSTAGNVDIADPVATVATEAAETTEAAQTQAATEPAATEAKVQGSLLLNAVSMTFTVVGESDDLYCGSIPRELITWESADESVATVDNGVVTAVGVGTTTISAEYEGQRLECTVGCLVEEESEISNLPAEIRHAAKKIPPANDGQVCHFYDDAGFIGDSVSYSLVLRANQTGEFGDAIFFVRGGNGIAGYVNHFKTIGYRGKEYSIEDAVAASGVKKLFVMIGVNDLGFMTVEETMDYYRAMMDSILALSPDVEVYIQSLLPVIDAGIQGAKNKHVDALNELLKAYAEENGFHYVDIYPYIRDHTGNMPEAYSSDASTHMNYDGTDIWIQVLKLYAATQTMEEN